MQPNALAWDELTPHGDLLIYFEDDLARWFSLLVRSGLPGDVRQADRLQESVLAYLDVQDTYELATRHGPLAIVEYRLAEPEASCVLAFTAVDDDFYSAEYCLLDHYMGEEDESGGIRLFAPMYGIAYAPVDTVLLRFMQGIEVGGESLLTPPSAVIEAGTGEISINTDEVNLRLCADNLAGQIVYVQMWRDAVNTEPRTWNDFKIATGDCLEFSDLDGDGPTYAGVTYYTVASIEPLGQAEAAQQLQECYEASGRTRICKAASR
jgi:hypothetical protein